VAVGGYSVYTDTHHYCLGLLLHPDTFVQRVVQSYYVTGGIASCCMIMTCGLSDAVTWGSNDLLHIQQSHVAAVDEDYWAVAPWQAWACLVSCVSCRLATVVMLPGSLSDCSDCRGCQDHTLGSLVV